MILSDGGEFERSFKEIFLPELELDIITIGSILNLGTKIGENKFSKNLYDKRDDFLIYMVRIPYFCSNIPSTVFYSVFGVEILRIPSPTSTCDEFRTFCQFCLTELETTVAILQYRVAILLKRRISKYFIVFQKFNDTSITFINSLFH